MMIGEFKKFESLYNLLLKCSRNIVWRNISPVLKINLKFLK